VGAMLSGKAPTHPLPLPFFRDASNYAREGLGSEMVGAWGVFAYSIMPKLKDPKTSAREALVIVQWPVDGGRCYPENRPEADSVKPSPTRYIYVTDLSILPDRVGCRFTHDAMDGLRPEMCSRRAPEDQRNV
jgi:hypothetical protein